MLDAESENRVVNAYNLLCEYFLGMVQMRGIADHALF